MKTISTLLSAAALSIGLFTATGANAALTSALGGQVVNDTDRNIVWLANANLADTNSFGVSGIDADGTMSWLTAQNWIGAMNTANYLGYNDWRLPTTLQPDPSCGSQFNAGAPFGNQGFGVNCTGSEMGHLFYNELGGTAGSSILTSGDPDLGLFSNLQSNIYWSGTEYGPNTPNAWLFYFNDGDQLNGFKDNTLYALAVRPGQVSAVPEPGSALLFGIGLLGLLGVARRRLALR